MNRTPRLIRIGFYLLVAGVAIQLVHAVSGVASGELLTRVIEDWLYNGVLVGAALVCVARAACVREERLAWALVGFGLVAWSAADLYYTLVLSKLDAPPYPSISDAGWLVFYPACWGAVVLLMRRRIREFHASLWLDGLVAALGVAALTAALVLPPIVAMSVEGEPTAVAVNLAYPVGDVLLLVLLVGALALTGWRPDRPLALVGVGLALSGAADIIYLSAIADGQAEGPAWTAWLWPASALATAAGAWQPVDRARAIRLEGRRLLVLPFGTMAAALVLLLIDHFERASDAAVVLAFATLAVAGLRLWLTLGEHMNLLGTSRGEAHTDELTGLANRRRLAEDLDAELRDVTRERPLLLMLFDLNGFKAYNDTYGHPAGDTLLARLGSALADAVAGQGSAYRMGGDEFCVLAALPATAHDAIASASRAALSEHGDGFHITAALGCAVLDRPDADPADALRIADRRMYAEKNGRRASAGGQSTAVLLRVIAERNPDLGEHVDGVALLAEQTAVELGMSSEQRTAVRQAAVLHDIGKAAVPDAILEKPGPLDEDEWAFMRRHTIIGERIMQAAPSLSAAAPLVRSSHESFDGSGYPDRLAGEDIPLGARIIAVCDAYDAMTSDRPYRAALSSGDALAELRRCAGTQFDPEVVRAFVATLERTSGPWRLQIADDHVAEHRAVVVAQPRVGEIAVEQRAERVAVRHAEDAEGADHHVQVDRVDVAAEDALGAAALEDTAEQVDRRAAELGDRR
jgi:two-component system, cell cycle response regulator